MSKESCPLCGREERVVNLPASSFQHLAYSEEALLLWKDGGFNCTTCGLRAPKKTWERLHDVEKCTS